VGIEYVTQTILASRDVRQNQSQVLSLMVAVTNLKTPEEKRVQAGRFKTMDRSSAGSFLLEAVEEIVQDHSLAFNLDEYPLWRVEHPATKIHLGGKTIHKGPKSYPLNGPPDDDMSPFDHDDADCSLSQWHHSRIPAPVVQEVSNTLKEGLILRAFCFKVSRLQFT